MYSKYSTEYINRPTISYVKARLQKQSFICKHKSELALTWDTECQGLMSGFDKYLHGKVLVFELRDNQSSYNFIIGLQFSTQPGSTAFARKSSTSL